MLFLETNWKLLWYEEHNFPMVKIITQPRVSLKRNYELGNENLHLHNMALAKIVPRKKF